MSRLGAYDHQAHTASPHRVRQLCAQSIEERFPGVRAWYGMNTQHWWAYVPPRRAHGDAPHLLEADNPGSLSMEIVAVYQPSTGRRPPR